MLSLRDPKILLADSQIMEDAMTFSFRFAIEIASIQMSNSSDGRCTSRGGVPCASNSSALKSDKF